MRLPVIGSLLALALLALSGLGARVELWSFGAGFLTLRIAFWIGLASAALALGLMLRQRRAERPLVAAIIVGCTVAFVPWNQLRLAKLLPFIHDVSTDTVDPPRFEAVLPLRAGARNSAEYGGDSIAARQRLGYPDLATVQLTDAPDAAFHRVRLAAESMGWEIVAVDSVAGRIEATATTFWFGFKDDVVIRVRPAPTGGSALDMRSLSRVGGSDVGANAARIRAFLATVRRSG